MGEAKRRGTFEQRLAQAQPKQTQKVFKFKPKRERGIIDTILHWLKK
jgi:hypothetical protein